MAQPDMSLQRKTILEADVLVAGTQGSPALVLIHGWNSNSQTWKGLAERLSADFYVVAINSPGVSGSACLPKYDILLHAEWLVKILSQLGVSFFSILGHSMGGNVAAQVVCIAPERVQSLVLVGAALYTDRPFSTRIYVRPVIGPILLAGAKIYSWLTGKIGTFVARLTKDEKMQAWAYRQTVFAISTSQLTLCQQMKALIAHPISFGELPRQLPILILHGEMDKTVPSAYAKEMYNARPNKTKLVLYPEGDHNIMDFYPDEVATDIRRFFQEQLQQ